eukprot:550868_1
MSTMKEISNDTTIRGEIDNQCSTQCPIIQNELYHEVISLSMDCGIIPILPQNINTKYKYVNSKYKLLINGYIKSETKRSCDYTLLSIIPDPIYRIITLFYTSFKSEELYMKQGETENDKQFNANKTNIINNLSPESTLVTGCCSDHEPTRLLSIHIVHQLLSTSPRDVNNRVDLHIFRQFADVNVIEYMCGLFQFI